MVQISSKLLPSSIQKRALCAPLAQNFTVKQLQNLNQNHAGDNESIVRDWFCCGSSDFSCLLKVRNSMPTVIYYYRYSLESMKLAIKCILGPDKVMNLSRGTVKFKLDKTDVLFLFTIFHKRQSYIFINYVKKSKNCPTEELVRLSSAFKIVYCLTELELKSKSTVCYVLVTLVLDPVSFLLCIIQKECSKLDVK